MNATAVLLAATATTAVPWWLAPAIVAAALTGLIGVCTLLVNGRRSRVDRQRVLFGQALGDLAGYREFVYIVRRRRHDEPAAERVRISTELSNVQQKLNQHSAVMRVESPRVARAFDELLRATRRVAGGAIRQGWDQAPIMDDSGIHIEVDLSEIDSAEATYIAEVTDHLSAIPGPLRRTTRSARHLLHRQRAKATAPSAGAAESVA